MKKILGTLAVASALALGAGTASFAGYVSQQETLGQMLAAGKISEAAFDQLIMHTGLTPDQAKGITLDQAIAKRWQAS